jgi:DnaJ-class molecular chaperone
MADSNEKTGAFDARQLNQQRCPDCSGSGELRIESENINENFDVEKQVVIAPCQRCGGTGFVAGG